MENEALELTESEQELLLVIKKLVSVRKSLPDIDDFDVVVDGLDSVIDKIGEAFILLANR